MDDMTDLKNDIDKFNTKISELNGIDEQIEINIIDLRNQKEEYRKRMEEIDKEIEQSKGKSEKNNKNKLDWAEICLNSQNRKRMIDECKKIGVSKSKINRIEDINLEIENGESGFEAYEMLIEYFNKVIDKDEINISEKKKSKNSLLVYLKEQFFGGNRI